MVDHHLRRQNLKNRQAPSVPVASGINQSSSLVVATSAATGAATLALDTTATAVPTEGATVPLAGSETVVLTSTVAGTRPTTGASATSSSGATNMLSMKTVIASCIGTLAGVLLLIIIGLALYRRYMRSLKTSYTSSKNRNAAREAERRRSHVEPWSKMGDEKSGGLQMKAAHGEVPMDKMFKTSPSIRTAYTHKSDEQVTMEMPQSLARYHPDLASKPSEAVTVHRPFLGRADSGLTIGWDADKDVASQHISTGSAENSPSIAIPTPVATRNLHRWESAEVINPDAEESASSSNPFETDAEQRKSRGNPFFKGTDYSHMRTRSGSIASLKTNRTKEQRSRAPSVASNATNATDATFVPNPPFIHHASSGSREEALSNPHAIQSLIRALDVTEQDIQDRLRIVSMQPSVLTMESMYTDDATPMPSPIGDRHTIKHQ
ncbi:hypothetical protein F5887DRAFT_537484 [Amanita rubescens]|nr:hypothetical protein F5887DRAFT_537484 [Amanita rubescens]